MNLDRFTKIFEEFNNFGKTDNGIYRLAYTAGLRDALKYLEKVFINDGMNVRMDSVGNMIARREGKDPNLPVVACGSHVDTVYSGGEYDGTVGVLGGLEAIRSLNDKNIETMHPIELIVFACEESSRFGVSTIGSKAMVGDLNVDSLLNLKDNNGITMEEAFQDNQLNLKDLGDAKRDSQEFKSFLELHIEQGPFLEDNDLQIGIVTNIAAPTRLKIEINGFASHSGSTSMLTRKDALLGAAELVLCLEKVAKEESLLGTVGTVGSIEIKPNSINTVPGYAKILVDIRGISKESKSTVSNALMKEIDIIEEKRGLDINWETISHEDPAQMDKQIQDKVSYYCNKFGFKHMYMKSGAGHDAMNMAKICPTGMIFIPSKNGVSHNPKEYTSMVDIERGIIVLKNALLDLAIPLNNED